MKKKMEAAEDLKILARIRSKERMQATRKRGKEEQIKQSVSNQSKFFIPLKTRLCISDVYSDSDNKSINEESPLMSHQASKSPAESHRKTDGTVFAAVLPKDIFTGLYVLVQLLCKSG
ncbi:hypothetical protein TNCT_243271 [Trichonephila clavata]|uniref:Uncharacterized protein n=1 Tax=Trichonephila clavata TaxID=2740835 RepID=A0A8X6M379_TRICU|nr:hypothetical protein TNCT_243271 [Trichonephila clavata]